MIPRSCAHHRDRPGHAACMSCRTVLCQECANTWDGIYYCAACLAGRHRGGRGRAAPIGWTLMLAASVLLFVLQARMTVWAGALLARLL